MDVFVGTSGFAYKEWKGKFYPPDIASKEMLAYYASQFNAVEINNTFYRMPNKENLESWSSQVPDRFLFALKAPRIITHIKRLKNVQQETEHFITMVLTLGDKLGPILFQLPPTFPFSLSRLEGFVDLLGGVRAAFEFRHESWTNADTVALLSAHNLALCTSDREPGEASEIVPTATWGYLRLRGPEYSSADLAAWRHKVLALQWDQAFVFFKHESEGAGPRMSMGFLQKR